MRSTFFPLELRFHPFFQFLLISAKCHNPLENHGRNEHHIFFIFAFPNFFLAWRWKMLFSHCVLQCFMFFSEMVWSIELPFSSRKNLMFVRAETETFYISHGWLKMCGQLNFQRSNIFQPSNIFQDSTSSNALHMTLLHPPPPPPICIQERPFWYSIKTEGSSKLRGTPSLEPLYIYLYLYL